MKIIRVTAIWCPSCLVMRKKWKQLEELCPDLEWLDYDYDEDEEIVKKYEVGTTLPVLIKAESEERLIGEKNLKQLKQFVGVTE